MERFEAFVFGNNIPKGVNNTMAKDERKDKDKPLSKDKIMCTDCGNVFAQRPDVREKRIGVFGSEKALENNYLCRECRKGQKWNGKQWAEVEKKKPAKKAKKDKKK